MTDRERMRASARGQTSTQGPKAKLSSHTSAYWRPCKHACTRAGYRDRSTFCIIRFSDCHVFRVSRAGPSLAGEEAVSKRPRRPWIPLSRSFEGSTCVRSDRGFFSSCSILAVPGATPCTRSSQSLVLHPRPVGPAHGLSATATRAGIDEHDSHNINNNKCTYLHRTNLVLPLSIITSHISQKFVTLAKFSFFSIL